MGVPKRKKSKMRMRQRRAANAYSAPQVNVCPSCGNKFQPHRVCPSCGHYKGRQIVSVELKG
ncbi:MAG: 50S ribosomal protein L32 [Verrucomicrobiae bacterium]|nr:50S ribosomal protein L32 [Verrucomicrobiae bacterium]